MSEQGTTRVNAPREHPLPERRHRVPRRKGLLSPDPDLPDAATGRRGLSARFPAPLEERGAAGKNT
jgi:hypothetical protein